MANPHSLIHEVHRRSLWQVLSIYLVGGWVVLQVVETLTESAGLPDWVPPFAVVLILIGLPIVLATAFIQEGVSHGRSHMDEDRVPGSDLAPDTEAAPASRTGPARRSAGPRTDALGGVFSDGIFTWRNSLVGGGLGFTLLGVTVAAYFVMRSTGVGPVASLAAQGVFGDREPLVLADFANTTDDPTLAEVVTEALRVDLTQSSAITLLSPTTISGALTLMGRDPAEPVTAEVALEIAVRRGLKAAVVGEVGAAGSGYILTASIVEAGSGEVLAPFRVTAANDDEVLGAIEKLSEKIREKAGESLRMIRAGDALEDVTTSSLEALRKFVEGQELTDRGEYARAVRLLEDALVLDPEFAMAWRQLAVTFQSSGGSLERQIEAATRAWELRGNLTEKERNLATAYYHRMVTGDNTAIIQAYENVLAIDPNDGTALNNLALTYDDLGQHERALELMERAAYGPGQSGSSWVNLVQYRIMARDLDGARNALDTLAIKYPHRGGWTEFDEWSLESHTGNHVRAHDIAESLSVAGSLGAGWSSFGSIMLSLSDANRGQLGEALQHLEYAVETYTEAERYAIVLRLLRNQMEIQLLAARDPATVRSLMRRAMDPELYQAVAPEVRDPIDFLRVAALTGDSQIADRLISGTEADLRADPSLESIYSRRDMREARALAAAAAGNTGEAVRIIEQIHREIDCQGCQRLFRAGLHLQAGDTTRAIAEFEAVLGPFTETVQGVLEDIVAHEYLGDIFYARGDAAAAAPHYAAFAEAWADADPALQPRVQRARERSQN